MKLPSTRTSILVPMKHRNASSGGVNYRFAADIKASVYDDPFTRFFSKAFISLWYLSLRSSTV